MAIRQRLGVVRPSIADISSLSTYRCRRQQQQQQQQGRARRPTAPVHVLKAPREMYLSLTPLPMVSDSKKSNHVNRGEESSVLVVVGYCQSTDYERNGTNRH